MDDTEQECLSYVDELIANIKNDKKQCSILPTCNPLYKKEEVLDHLEKSKGTISKFCRLTWEDLTDKYENLSNDLKSGSFSNWKYDHAEQLIFLFYIFKALGIMDFLNVDNNTLKRFLTQIYIKYNNNPFHNFAHCFCVSQMTYAIICQSSLTCVLSKLNIASLFTSAICHDLDHPGFNNSYQVHAQTSLAILYNDASPLENHHCCKAFEIINKENCNLTVNLNKEDKKEFRRIVILCVLATDMTRHSEIIENFKKLTPTFNYENIKNIDILLQMIIKAADISNEARPGEVADPWVESLLREFHNQSDIEIEKGYPVAPPMKRSVTKAEGQIGFIKFCVYPLFVSLCQLLPELTSLLVTPTELSLARYQDLKQKEDEGKLKNSKEELNSNN